ncbi:MAG: hypothetical protein LBD02_08675 [Christensenellaceae bacterium]|nr:hypothetical protein [Christensenellaceae bacterium]
MLPILPIEFCYLGVRISDADMGGGKIIFSVILIPKRLDGGAQLEAEPFDSNSYFSFRLVSIHSRNDMERAAIEIISGHKKDRLELVNWDAPCLSAVKKGTAKLPNIYSH